MIAARDWFLEKNAGRGISSAIKLRVFSPTIISKEVGLGPMSGHRWRKYAKDESGAGSSEAQAGPEPEEKKRGIPEPFYELKWPGTVDGRFLPRSRRG